MKSRDLFCTSHASTAICSSMDQRRIVRPISRRTPATAPCSSQLPFHPTYSYIRKTSSPKHSSSPTFLNQILSDSKNIHALVPYQPLETKLHHNSGDTPVAVIPSSSTSVVCNPSVLTRGSNAKSSSSSTPTHRNHQVVELRVAIHCKGCEGKVRKHLSKMEGVTSFSIDLDSKKVTVIGNVTPLGVLANISKVKNAQIWPSSPTSSPSVTLPIR